MARLENKVAIITGAAGGMGEAETRLFAFVGNVRALLSQPSVIDEEGIAKKKFKQIVRSGVGEYNNFPTNNSLLIQIK